MRQVRSSTGSPGRVRPRLSAISNTPDPIIPDDDDEYTAARSAPSDGDRDVVDARQRLTQNGRTSSTADRVGNRHVTATDDEDAVRRRSEAELHALLREFDIE